MKAILVNILKLIISLFKSLLSFGIVAGAAIFMWLAFTPGFFNRLGLISPQIIRVGVVQPFGAAGLVQQNEGFEPNEKSSFFQDYGFQVKIVTLKDEAHATNMLLADSIDLVNLSTASFTKYLDTLAHLKPQLVMLAGWSRGNDALVVRKGITSIDNLFELPVAYVPETSQFFFLKWLLKWSGLEQDEIEAIEVSSEEEAMNAFVDGKVRAVVLSNENIQKCINLVSGDAEIIQTTKTASHILDHSYWVPKEFYQDHKKKVARLMESWLKGNVLMKIDDDAQKKVLKYFEDQYKYTATDAGQFLRNTYFTGYRDNKNFLGVNKTYAGVKAKEIYEYAEINNLFIDTLQKQESSIRNFEVIIDTTSRKRFDFINVALYARRNNRRLYVGRAKVEQNKKKQLVFQATNFRNKSWDLKQSGYYLKYQRILKDPKHPDGYELETGQLDNIANIAFEFDEENGIVIQYQTLFVSEVKRFPSDFNIKIADKYAWKNFVNTEPLLNFELAGEYHLAERIQYQTQSMQNSKDFRSIPSVASYQLEVHYPESSIRLPVEAKGQLDKEFLLMAKIFGRCMIRVEAKADEWNDLRRNDYFAYKRAEAVANYLVADHQFNPRRFILLGNDTLNTTVINNETDYNPNHWIHLALLDTDTDR